MSTAPASEQAVAARTQRARTLRRQSTDAEGVLWSLVRNRNLGGLKFVRQLSVGPYFADFACREAGLIIELDGGQHSGSVADEIRTGRLNAEGYSVLRFWNNDMLANPNGCWLSIQSVIAGTPSPDLRFAPATLSPTGRGTRGARAARAAFVSQAVKQTRSVPLPVGERLGEGSSEDSP